ncbi:Glutamate receptor ionotropic, kainate 2 [Nymphon striatum]|nr:Glutamate receptor ionotropic, kainate 2 [Nymphon striatum]
MTAMFVMPGFQRLASIYSLLCMYGLKRSAYTCQTTKRFKIDPCDRAFRANFFSNANHGLGDFFLNTTNIVYLLTPSLLPLFIFTRNTYVRRGKSVTDHLASLLAILTRLDSCVTSLLKCKFLKFETLAILKVELSLTLFVNQVTRLYSRISVFLFLVARFSPYEWQCPHPCNQNSEILENQFTLMNSLWFIVGSLMQQGSDLAPKAWSTRMVAGTWWFFTLIMISSYTANLAAFLTVQRMVSPIESAEDLVQQTKIKYGCYGGGSTEAFFRNSQMETYRRMWAFMESARPSVFVTSGKLGIKKAMKGDYAYLMESTSIEYVTQRTCNLTQIGGLLDSKGYGIATQQGSPYRQLISGAILQLQEETMLDVLKIRWWRQKRGGAKCNKEDSKKGSTGTANELSLANVGGVFVVLLCGTGFAFIIAFIEFLWKTQRNKEDGRDSLCAEMLKELKFAVSCESSVRHVPKKNDFNAPESSYNFVTFTSFPSMSSKEPLS